MTHPPSLRNPLGFRLPPFLDRSTDPALTIHTAAHHRIRRLTLHERGRPSRWLGVGRLIGDSREKQYRRMNATNMIT
jgi:hypothetical protein